MTDSPETALRRALHAEADQLPPEAVDRLQAIDFHPRTHRISPRLTIGAAAGVAASTAAAVSIFVVGSASPAFAGWQATPTTPSAGQLATAEASCRAQLATHSPVTSIDGQGSSSILTDVRGPYTVAIYAEGSSDVTCFAGPSFTAVSANTVTSKGYLPVIPHPRRRSTPGSTAASCKRATPAVGRAPRLQRWRYAFNPRWTDDGAECSP